MVWGSDWPVANLGAGLPGWLAITEATLARLSTDEAAAISHGNAERIYGVPRLIPSSVRSIPGGLSPARRRGRAAPSPHSAASA